jgi:hypothetical protein
MFKLFDGVLVKTYLDFSLDMFRLTFIHLTYLTGGRPSNMVFKHLQDLFNPKDLINNISQLFMVCCYVIVGHISRSIAKALGVTRLLTLAKPSSGIQPIVIGEVFYQLVNRTLCL